MAEAVLDFGDVELLLGLRVVGALLLSLWRRVAVLEITQN